jgi:hypothetical protein
MKPDTHKAPELSKEIQRGLGEKLRAAYGDILSHLPAHLIILSRKVSGTQQEIPGHDELPEVKGPEGNILDPETTTILQTALDEGWAVIHRTGNSNITREDLAKRLIALIWTGERRPSKLLIHAFRTLLRRPSTRDPEAT